MRLSKGPKARFVRAAGTVGCQVLLRAHGPLPVAVVSQELRSDKDIRTPLRAGFVKLTVGKRPLPKEALKDPCGNRAGP